MWLSMFIEDRQRERRMAKDEQSERENPNAGMSMSQYLNAHQAAIRLHVMDDGRGKYA